VEAGPQGLKPLLQKVAFGQDRGEISSSYSKEYAQCQNLYTALVMELENFTLICLPTQRPTAKVLHESVCTLYHPPARHIHSDTSTH